MRPIPYVDNISFFPFVYNCVQPLSPLSCPHPLLSAPPSRYYSLFPFFLSSSLPSSSPLSFRPSIATEKQIFSGHYSVHRVLPGRACTLRCPQGVLASVRALSIYEVPPRQQERIAMPSDLWPLTVLPYRCTYCSESSRRERGKERSQQERIVAPEDRQRKVLPFSH